MIVVAKYATLTYAAMAYGVLLGDNWHWYAMALMLAAIRSHYLQSPERARVPNAFGPPASASARSARRR